MNVDDDNTLTGQVIGATIAVHRALGPGLDEIIYEKMLSAQLLAQGIHYQCQAPLPLRYKGVKLDCGYRMDFWVERRLVVELKSLETLLPIHEAQLLTYLRLSECELGLIINFDVPVLKQGVRRRVWTVERSRPLSRSPNQDARIDQFDPLSGEVLAAAVEVHATLGPGLLRSAYEECLCYELEVRGTRFERLKKLPARFREIEIPEAVEIPLLVAGELPVVCLSVAKLTPLHQARLLGRLRQGGWPSSLLLNFNVPALPQGIQRVVNSGGRHRRDATDPERTQGVSR
jgi:GxxExxY protein